MEKKSENAPHVAELLLSAARTGDRSGVIAALADPLSQPNFALFDGFTALMVVAKAGHASVVEVLLGDERVDRNIVSKEYGSTALMLAAYKGHASVVEVLLGDELVDRNIVDKVVGFTALIAAADKGHASVVTLLLADKRVDPGVADPSG